MSGDELADVLAKLSTDSNRDVALRYLDDKTAALVMIGAAISLDADRTSYGPLVTRALAAGATHDEVLGVLVAVAPSIGAVRVVTAAPRISFALGYDIGEALEIA